MLWGASSRTKRQREHVLKMDRRTCHQCEYDKVAAMCKNSTQKPEGSDQLILVKTSGNTKSHLSQAGTERITRRDGLDKPPPWGTVLISVLRLGE